MGPLVNGCFQHRTLVGAVADVGEGVGGNLLSDLVAGDT